jgi:hypothetical protein
MSAETNTGMIDRVVRVGVGGLLLWMFAQASGPSLTFLGIAPLLSGLLGFCPLYFYADLSTYKQAKLAPRPSTASHATS